ncbi:MAG: carbon monoxide dehydrogenase [Chitinophagaceae bacterium]|nr:MAG: carbon monoxide dehydrogenase [Chitinophagaceae bacterium]
MQLKGNRIVNAVPGKVWELLMNPDTLAKVVPGITSLEAISEHSFTSSLHIKIGPVSGTFSGKLQLEDIVDGKSFTLNTQQNSKIGNANATLQIVLSSVGDQQTEVIFDGNAKLSGMLASMGQRIIGGIANTLTNQFFSNLQNEIAITTNAE